MLRESFRDDRDQSGRGEVGQVVEVGHHACVEVVAELPALTDDDATRRSNTVIGNGYDKATFRWVLPRVVVVDCSEENLLADEKHHETHLCHNCMQIKVNGVDRMRDVIRGKDQQSKRSNIYICIRLV